MKENNITDFAKVGLYGLTYKENIDDMRESPTLQLLQVIQENKIKDIRIYDPWITEDKFDNQYHDIENFLEGELVIVLVQHDEIKEKQELLSNKIVYDTRNVIKFGKRIYKLVEQLTVCKVVKMSKRISILGSNLDILAMDETIDKVEELIASGTFNQHVVINASKINLMHKDRELTNIINDCPLINADGQSILWAGRFLGYKIRKE